MEQTVDTKHVTGRRELHFDGMDDIWADVAALDGKELVAAGNWSPAQIIQHVDLIIGCSLDGFDPKIKVPLPLRLFARVIKGGALKRTMKPGIKLPANLSGFLPLPGIPWEQARDTLRGHIDRIRGGELMEEASPFFGPMTHQDWIRLHCRHAEMHFGFIHEKDGGR
ncbi:MAG: DUF1569 domain-containing protein [Phycisphaerales bacterium]|nr:DUF1569 domain-containing protein [Phycisphaerae bacterium]NNF41924.1 DUF1569 domain-containing protein [Phycisphaerales bacterium]NNM26588.1 DUF1569 domain-containing protein [Phycisphaerales bacterium]